jgi:hypothetical protein
MRPSLLLLLALLAVLAWGPLSSDAQTVLLTRSSPWKYWDKGALTDLTWMQPSFGDSTWPSGPAALGYVLGSASCTTPALPLTLELTKPQSQIEETLRSS